MKKREDASRAYVNGDAGPLSHILNFFWPDGRL